VSWPLGKVSDIANVISGYAFKSDWFGTGKERIIRIGDLQNGRISDDGVATFDSAIYKVSEQFKIQPNDILMALSGATVGKIAIAQEKDSGSYLNQRVAIVRAKSSENAGYLKYVFSGYLLQKLLLSAGGAAQPNLSPKSLADMEIPLPPLAEQKRIAAILDKADSLCRKRQQAIQLADQFLRAVFLDMFGDPVTNPKGWEVKTLGELIKSGPSNGLYKHASDYGEGTRILRIDGFYSGALSAQSNMKRVRLNDQELMKYQLQDRSIVINRVNSREYLGKSAFIGDLEEPTVFESNMMNFSVDEKRINPRFLVEQLQTPFIKNQILMSAKDAVNQSSINQQDVKAFNVVVPDLVLQKKFETICTRYAVSKVNHQDSQIKGEQLFYSLSQKAFAGEL
jgi:type I restriction enzyme S subunit